MKVNCLSCLVYMILSFCLCAFLLYCLYLNSSSRLGQKCFFYESGACQLSDSSWKPFLPTEYQSFHAATEWGASSLVIVSCVSFQLIDLIYLARYSSCALSLCRLCLILTHFVSFSLCSSGGHQNHWQKPTGWEQLAESLPWSANPQNAGSTKHHQVVPGKSA